MAGRSTNLRLLESAQAATRQYAIRLAPAGYTGGVPRRVRTT